MQVASKAGTSELVAPMRKVTRTRGRILPLTSQAKISIIIPSPTSFPPQQTRQSCNRLVFRYLMYFDADHNLYSASSDWWDTLGVPHSLPIKPMVRSAFPSECICVHLHHTTFEPLPCTSGPALIPLPLPSCPVFHLSSLSVAFCTTSIIPQP